MSTTLSTQENAVNEFIANCQTYLSDSDTKMEDARQRLRLIQEIIDRKREEAIKRQKHHAALVVG